MFWDEKYKRYRDAKRGKKYNGSRVRFQNMSLEGLHILKEQLTDQTYLMSPYNQFKIYEPKERVIESCSFKDKIVQHVFCDNVLHPGLKDVFIRTNYAGQIGKGTDFGRECLKEQMLSFYSQHGLDGWILKCDIRKFFYRIDHDVLKDIVDYWINALNEENEENILFCIEKQYLRDACQLFSYYFEAEDEEMEEIQNNEKVENNIQESSNTGKSIVNYNKTEFDYVIDGISKNLYGHEAFKKDLGAQLQSFILLHKMGRKKLFSTLICGKSGIGKTEVGRVLQKLMYPKELPIKINFGNYSGKGSLWSLIGSPKGYVGSEQGGELTNKIIKSKSKVIVIDELDKADDAIYTFFYEMLEDGQYTDLDGNLIDLDGYIVIFTANLSNKTFKDKIPEPLFSRFDMTYEFQPLTKEEITQYIAEYVDELIKDYSKVVRDFDIEKVRSQILNRDYSACDNLRIIKKNVMNDFVREVVLCQDLVQIKMGDFSC